VCVLPCVCVCGFGVLEGFVVLVGSWCVFLFVLFLMALFFVFLFWLGGYLFFLLSFNQFWCFCCFGGFSCPVVFVLLYF
jgi:hypothetical protein